MIGVLVTLKFERAILPALIDQNSYRSENCITRGPPLPLACTSLTNPAAVSLKLRFGSLKLGWLKMLNVSHRNWNAFRSPTRKRFDRLRLMFCVPGPSRMFLPEVPGWNGMNPYLSGEQFVR